MKYIFTQFCILLLLTSCSPKLKKPDPETLKPAWLKTQPYLEGYYTGIGHSIKDGTNNYVQAAKKSALDDLVSEIKVTISSTSVLSQMEQDNKFREKYEEIIQTSAADEIEEFEFVEAWEDDANYWVCYKLSIGRYKQIKEEQKRDAVLLATDYFKKAKQAEKDGDRLTAISFYFQSFRSIEKYLGEPITVTLENQQLLLVNEVYAAIQFIMDKISLQVTPAEIVINRRLNQNAQTVLVKSTYNDLKKPAVKLPLTAAFDKGAGDVFPTYTCDEKGQAKILINKISSRDLEQTIHVKLAIDLLSSDGGSPVYNLLIQTFHIPSSQILLKVKRPIVFMTVDEKSFGLTKTSFPIGNKLKTLLTNAGFEFSDSQKNADLWVDVKADAEKGAITGSIYATYLTSTITVKTVKGGTDVYATTLDRIKGYGLDYDKSSIDSYNKAIESVEKNHINELLNIVLQ